MTAPAAIGIAGLAEGRAPGRDGFQRLAASEAEWRGLALGCAAGLHDLSALWSDGATVFMALVDAAAPTRAIVSLPLRNGGYPALGRHHRPAIRLERALRDLRRVEPEGLPDRRPWLDHGVWPEPAPGQDPARRPQPGYDFLPVQGEGLHQIPVGPVHAGIIEPGHFRFTANGEAVVRLEERLGYVHKGVEALCAGADLVRAARVTARISGDATVAWSWAFALAVEAALGVVPPRRAVLLRGVMAELERIAHHVNDVGMICNDASVVALQARCALMRERILQVAERGFGHRLMMDRIVPGGVAADLDAEAARAILALLQQCLGEFEAVLHVYDGMPSLQDRTVTTGRVSAELVREFAAGGHVGRASGRPFDARAVFPYAPYGAPGFRPALRQNGDVDARLEVRADEVRASVGLVRQLLKQLEPGELRAPLPGPQEGEAAAMVESFRGDVFLALSLGADGRVAGFHARDPSWFQWPLLEAAIEGNIVADFPLCNKSFNCSYSGQDM